jgi:phenylalanyl-tRNA synthetase alpha chain
MLLVVIKVSSIEDTTQKELCEIESTGTLSAGEKSLADLRKRKLAVQKFATFNSLFMDFRG